MTPDRLTEIRARVASLQAISAEGYRFAGEAAADLEFCLAEIDDIKRSREQEADYAETCYQNQLLRQERDRRLREETARLARDVALYHGHITRLPCPMCAAEGK